MSRDTRENIVNALLVLALENPTRHNFSISEIADRAGISRQAIYQKHFNNYHEIVLYLRHYTDQEINAVFKLYDSYSGQNPFDYFSE